MCAKISGIPWTISNIPFDSMPTMVLGVDKMIKVKGKNKYEFLSVMASMNKTFSKFWSSSKC
jgi:hypothetical protein